MSSPSQTTLLQGTHQWILSDEVHGKGAFSSVRLARCGDIPAVVKTTQLSDNAAARQKQLLYVRREVECLVRLRGHANICQLYDVVEEQDAIHLVLEFIDGVDLFTFLQHQNGTRVPEDTLRDLVIQLLTALDFMHTQGVLHRDLKLDNMMLTRTGVLKLIDFNLGIALEPGTMGQVGLNDAVGTPQFASPLVLACGLQQQQNKLLAKRGVNLTNPSYIAHECLDLWSVGVCINGLATGRFPFHAKDPQPLLQEIKEYAMGQRSIYFPRDLSPIIKHFIQRLLSPGKATTAREMMSHPWVAADFAQELARTPSPAPSMVSTVISSSEKIMDKIDRQRHCTEGTLQDGSPLTFNFEKHSRHRTDRSEVTLSDPIL